jgi:hypothetical protein
MNSGESEPPSKPNKQENTLASFLERLGIRSAAAFSRRLDCNEKTVRNWRKLGGEPTLTISQFRRLMSLLDAAGMTLEDVPDRFYPEDKENP